MTSEQEAAGWLQTADDTLRSARDNLHINHYSVAVSLAYYAAFYAAKSVIAFSKELDPRTHKGLVFRFREVAVNRSDFPAEIAAFLSQLFEHRRNTDYDYIYRDTWDRQKALVELRKSEHFVEEVHSWVERNAKDTDDGGCQRTFKVRR